MSFKFLPKFGLKRILLSLSLLIFVAACGSTSGTAKPEPTAEVPSAGGAAELNELTICLGSAGGFDPTTCAARDPAMMIDVLYEGLYRYTSNGIELAGAKSVEVSDDGLIWTLNLREEARWSDGKPVTADDYVFSIRRLVNPVVGSGYALAHGGFVKNATKCFNGELPFEELGVRAVDDFTLEIELEAPCAYFDAFLAYTTFYPLREEITSMDGTTDWTSDPATFLSNGPMKFVEIEPNQYCVFEKSETYYGRDEVNLDRLTVKAASESNTKLALFNAGDVDMITDYPSEETESLISRGLYHGVPTLRTGYLYVNHDREPFNDPRVRRAFALCIDREFLCDVLLSGTKIAATSFVGMGFPGATADEDFYSESPKMLYYDPDEARQLLADAGYPGGAGFPVLELPYRSMAADNATVFEYLQSVWKEELGVESTLFPQEAAVGNLARDEHRFTFFLENWGADYFDASDLLALHTTGHFMNFGNYNSQEYNDLYQASTITIDNARRIGLLHQAEQLLIEKDTGVIPLYYWTDKFIFDENVVTNVTYLANSMPKFVNIIVNK
ncbi:MAG: peptide ABC transporter substrate-binding protein [Clostridiales bacterium]|jgi:oligopeptide transport system substrate-binding protein|nr:peptide ABC transporter substrate-binding protein [Clostridiales bacterium]